MEKKKAQFKFEFKPHKPSSLKSTLLSVNLYVAACMRLCAAASAYLPV